MNKEQISRYLFFFFILHEKRFPWEWGEGGIPFLMLSPPPYALSVNVYCLYCVPLNSYFNKVNKEYKQFIYGGHGQGNIIQSFREDKKMIKLKSNELRHSNCAIHTDPFHYSSVVFVFQNWFLVISILSLY